MPAVRDLYTPVRLVVGSAHTMTVFLLVELILPAPKQPVPAQRSHLSIVALICLKGAVI